MKRGEIWWVNFDRAVGSEIKKTRPATSITQKLYPPECYVQIKEKHSKVMADQIMTVSKERLYDCMGSVTPEEMDDIQRILLIQLGIKSKRPVKSVCS